ncbi:hypothetical protein [Tepidicaulis sp.]|uniref:hypothetical protein n=1 Tax=Tepidicaulis sp. TaxID=1920809 RepID=UPI003B5A7C42
MARPAGYYSGKAQALLAALTLALPLAACSDDGWWIFSEDDASEEITGSLSVRPSPQAAPEAPPITRQSVEIELPQGAPSALSNKLQEELRVALARQSVTASSLDTLQSAFKLKTAVKAAANASGIIVLLVADMENRQGERLHRAVIEQRLPPSPSANGNVWQALSEEDMQRLAGETVNKLGAWPRFAELKGPGLAPAETPRALYAEAEDLLELGPEITPAGFDDPAALTADDRLATASTAPAAAPAATLAGETRFLVTVRAANAQEGAAGRRDGTTLARALRQALTEKDRQAGRRLEAEAGYFVTGNIKTAPRGEGRTQVEIEWQVAAKDGTPLGLVRQANDVANSEIDRSWGLIAEAAGKAAADGILELLAPQKARS